MNTFATRPYSIQIVLAVVLSLAALVGSALADVAYAQAGPSGTLLTESEWRQVIQFNPSAALQQRIFADRFVPNSAEFTLVFEGAEYAAQRAENLGSGAMRVYYVAVGDWGNVRVTQGGDALVNALMDQAQAKQVIQFNPGAALQKLIFAQGFVPNSAEFNVSVGGTRYAAQRAEHLGTGEVRVYYVADGDWGNVQSATRPEPIDGTATRGVNQTLVTTAPSGTVCSLAVTYADGRRDTSPELGPKTPDNRCFLSWTWPIHEDTALGRATVVIACGSLARTVYMEVRERS